MTRSASAAIDRLTEAHHVTRRGGFRLVLDGPPCEGAAVEVEAAPCPGTGDDVVVCDGSQLFLSRADREGLTEKVLDVREDTEGHYEFLIADARG
ncbi:iron-sulfur cluster biosynthesis protein [Amycolatopsis sp. NPDC004368]